MAAAAAAAAAATAAQAAKSAADTTAGTVKRVQSGVGGQIVFLTLLLFGAWIYASGRSLAVIEAIRGAPPNPAKGKDAKAGTSPTPTTGGSVGGAIRRAEEERKRRENPNAPILDDTPVPGSPGGAWTPGELKRWGQFL